VIDTACVNFETDSNDAASWPDFLYYSSIGS
jgi:hypothetical protein